VSAVGQSISGIAAAPGIAQGRWAEVGRPALPAPRLIEPAEVPDELARLRAAAMESARELRALAESVKAEGHEPEAAIFGAHALMARDPDLLDAAAREIEGPRSDAASAIMTAARAAAASLAALADERIRARATDILDVADRIARHVLGLPTATDLAAPAVLVAEDLPPSITATLPRDRVLGLVLEGSSPTAHAAILARAYGIPAVVGAAGVLAAVRAAGRNVEIAVDGSTGEVIVAPDADVAARFQRLAAESAHARARDLADATAPAVTIDGVEVTLLANIGGPDEATGAVALGAAGVGLFRTEFLFLERAAPPSEDEQAAAYRQVVEAFPGRPVTIRLLDVGGDKPIPYLPLPKEDNPFLGVRALRLARERPDLFLTQLRACHRAAIAGPVRVMAPMIADASDAAVLLDLATRARDSLAAEGVAFGPIELGVMLEIPSAVLTAASYFDRIAFASLGTNDLLQYTLAVDRGNPALERYRDALHPAQLRLIRLAVEAAAQHGISLSVCGEMAGEPLAALALVGLGIRVLSMVAPSLPAVRRAIRTADASRLAAEADAACIDGSAAEARARFAELLAG
jgi:phosphoenolpyruvate-protein phosphotransferase